MKYYVRWRHIPPYLMMTPLMYISVDHSQIEVKEKASEWEIKTQLGKDVDVMPDHITIESIQEF